MIKKILLKMIRFIKVHYKTAKSQATVETGWLSQTIAYILSLLAFQSRLTYVTVKHSDKLFKW